MNEFDLYVDKKLVRPGIQEEALGQILLEYGAGHLTRELRRGEAVRALGRNLLLVTTGTAPARKHSTPFEGSIKVLADRAKKLGRKAGYFASSGLALLILGIGLYALGINAEPSVTIDHISVPSSVVKAFAEDGAGNGASAQFEPAVSAAMLGLLDSTFVKALGGLMLMAGIVSTVVRQTLTPLFVGIFAVTSPQMMSFLLTDLDPESVKRSEFEVAVEAKAPRELQRLLDSKEGLDEVAKSFILAQAFVAEGAKSIWINQAADSLREDKMKGQFEVDPQIRYAIEQAANVTGTSELSPAAQTYFDEAQVRAALYKRMGTVQWVLSGMLITAALVFAALKQLIMRRVRRITDMLPALVTTPYSPVD